MIVARSRAEVVEWRNRSRAEGVRTVLVPTMGSLHRGHLSLAEIGATVGRVGLSIFVNPLQFGPSEDFASYPREIDTDLELAEAAGVSLVFAPSVEEMYPDGTPWVAVVPEKGADRLCGLARPGHFRGVLTVVAKLFGVFTPDAAVFGQKDYQQLTLIRRMVADLDMPVDILAGPIVREADGLAMSSRNRYLSGDDRRAALSLVRALEACEGLFEAGERDPVVYRERLAAAGGGGVAVEYGEVVHPVSLEPVVLAESGSVCAIAARVGSTRLIDNHVLGTGSPLPSAE